LSEYKITDSPGLELLRRAIEAADRADQAAEILARDGISYVSRLGETKVSPLVGVERDARNAQRQLLRELAVTSPPTDPQIARAAGRFS